MIKTIYATLVLVLFGSFATFAQQTAPTVPMPMTSPTPTTAAPNLETILTEAQKQSEAYREAFRNLLAEETKTFEEFGKTGEVEETTVVKSNFLVYQSGKKATVTSELRNVLEVNGKLVPNSQQRSNEFFGRTRKGKNRRKGIAENSERRREIRQND